jgi:hypothetical protein
MEHRLMSALRLTGSTSGYSELTPPAIAGDQTFTLPGAGGTLDRLNRAGNVLQVVSATYSTQTVIATTTLTDTGLSASITPASASNKILVLVDQSFRSNRSAVSVVTQHKLLRGSTIIHSPASAEDYILNVTNATAVDHAFHACLLYLDSPNATSSVTYKTQAAVTSTSNSGSTTAQSNSQTSTMILLEVAA